MVIHGRVASFMVPVWIRLPTGVLIGPEFAGHELVDDGDARIRRRVLLVEETAAAQRNAHRLEIISAYDAFVRVEEEFAGLGRTALNRDGSPRIHFAQGQRGNTPGRGHAGKLFQALPEFAIGGKDGGTVGVAGTRHGQPQRQHALGIEARCDIQQTREAAQEQAGADRQDHRETEFGDHQQAPQAIAAAGRAAAAVFQAGVQIQTGKAQCGRQSEEYCREDGEPEGEGQRASIHGDLVQAGHALRSEHVNPPDAPHGKEYAERTSRKPQYQAFGEQLPDDAGPSGAERGSHRHLLTPRQGSSQEKVRDIGAGDSEHEGNSADQNQQRPPGIAHYLLAQRYDAEGEAAVGRVDVRVITAQARGDRVHGSLRLRDGNAALQLADHVVVLTPAVLRGGGRQGKGQQDVGIFGAPECGQHLAGQRKTARQHTDDGVVPAIEGEGPADDAGIAAEAPRPGAVTQDGGGGGKGGVLGCLEKTSHGGASAEHDG